MITFGLTCHLELRPNEIGNAATTTRQIVDTWALDTERRGQQLAPPRNFTRNSRSFEDGIATVWESTLAQDADDGGTWITEIRCHTDASYDRRAILTIAMRIHAAGSALAPVRYYVETPSFVRQLPDRFLVRIGASTASSSVHKVHDEAGVEMLLADLQRVDRTLPIIIVTEPVREPMPIPDLAERLASFLFGLATVVQIGSSATFVMTRAVGREMSVFDGGLRVYWPGWSSQDPLGRHPLFLRARIQFSASYDVERPDRLIRSALMAMLARTSAARFTYPDEMQGVVRSHQRNALQQEIAASSPSHLAEEVKALRQKVADLLSLQDTATALEALWTDERNDLRDELRGTRKELERLRSAIAAKDGEVAAQETSPWAIEDLTEALERARSDFDSTLIIPSNVKIETSERGGFWYHALLSLHQLCEADRRGDASDKRTVLRDCLARNGLGPKRTYKAANTDVWINDPTTGQTVECRERVHIVEGKRAETESIYWTTIGNERGAYRYLVAKLGRHA